MLLYGVNNIAEIDQEKAKKLAEDLDLLDGLKVSVRHCEEVMEANKDRYPILETANRILVTTNEELKADIQACELAIRKLNGEDVVTAGGRVLGVVAVQNDLVSVIEKSYSSVKKVHFDNAFYRNDIGAKALKVLKEG